MNIAICDDNPVHLTEYKGRITAILEKNQIAARVMPFSSCHELMFAMEENDTSFDILYLDIHMDGMDGMEMATWVRERNFQCEIVFITVSQNHMLSAFDVHAYHYVVKERTTDAKFSEILLKVVAHAQKKKQQVLTVTCAGESRMIPISEILYFEVQNYIIVVHYGDHESFEFYSTLGKIENALLGHGFLRVHRSYLINLNQMRGFVRQEVLLSDGAKIPVGRKYTDQLRQEILKEGA